MTPEKKVQNKIINTLKKLINLNYNVWYERRQAGGYSYHAGLADIYVLINGIHFEVEVKQLNGHQSPLQEKWEKKCEKLNIKYICVYSVEDFYQFLKDVYANNILKKI